MKIEKRFLVAATPERLWAFINDPERVGPCIPGCREVKLLEPGKYRAVITVQVGPIQANIAGIAELREERPPEFAEYSVQAEEGGNASRISAVSKLSITPINDQECEVGCVAEVSINGRLGKFGAGIMQKIADNLGDKFAAALRAELEKDNVGEVTASPAEPETAEGFMTKLGNLLVKILKSPMALFGKSRS